MSAEDSKLIENKPIWGRQREALVLQVYGGLSYLEIAEVMGVPMTTVRNWIVRAKDKMRKIVAPYFQESEGETADS